MAYPKFICCFPLSIPLKRKKKPRLSSQRETDYRRDRDRDYRCTKRTYTHTILFLCYFPLLIYKGYES